MIKDLIIHIGDPKCGSSSIQTALQQGACTSDAAVIVPQREMNASALANALNPDRGPQEPEAKARHRMDQLQEKAAWVQEQDGDLGVISAEFFDAVAPQALEQALQEFLPEQAPRTRIIAYVRPHADRILSGHAQQIKAGQGLGSLHDFTARFTRGGPLFYMPRFSGWRAVFGRRFTLRPFVREELRDQDVVSDFFHVALEGAPFRLQEIPSVNELLALEELAAMQRLQSHLRHRDVPQFLRLSLGGALGRALVGFAGQTGRHRGKLQLDRANAERLRRAFAEDAAALDAQFWGRPLMRPALDQAVETAAAKAQSLEADQYYSAAALLQLDQLAAEFAALVKERPLAWRYEYQRQQGQRPGWPGWSDTDDQGQARRRNAKQVWALLDEIVALLLPDPAAQQAAG